MPEYVLSVGMEVHAELLTESKMFCRCPVAFGGEPNTRTCPVCIGLPGALPKPNRMAIELVMRTALALNCTIPEDSIFHRKNYFYPDLAKGYQTSQYGDTNPIGYGGFLDIPTPDGGTKRIGIRRVHLEEDTGKLMHFPSGGSGIDYNRAGVPLMEIVTEFPPDIQSPDEAREYLVQLRQILVYLGVCNGKMEEGSLRCEPNISVRPEGQDKLGTKTEIKNLSSFRNVYLGVQFEMRRQIATLEQGGTVLQETRGWNEATETSFGMRVKEHENDYRYFPCPDLVPMHLSREWVEEIRKNLPELPLAKQLRYQRDYGLSEYDAGVLTADRDWAAFFEACVAAGAQPKLACNLMNGDFVRLLKESGQVIQEDGEHEVSKLSANHITELSNLISTGEASSKTAKDILEAIFQTGEMPSQALERLGLKVVNDDSQIEGWIQEVLQENPAVVEKYKSGQTNTMGFLVGNVMKKSGGKANPPKVQELMRKALDA